MEIIFQFLPFITISIFFHLGFAQPGFLSLDCGGSTNYTDSAGIQWIPDDNFINGGTKLALQAVPFGSDGSIQLTTQRTFPESLKKCYVFSALDSIKKYLVRATFGYANNSNPPVFQLILDVSIWDTISFINNTQSVIVKEIVVMPKSGGIIHVCLGRAQIGVPFISSLELRTLGPNMYAVVNQSYSLLKLERTDFGGSKNSRYPDDPYDRIWHSSVTEFSNISTQSNVFEGTVPDQPPSLVMRTSQTSFHQSPSRMDLPALRSIKNGYLYFSLYFAELEKLNASSIREFDVYLDNNLFYGGLEPKYLEATNVSAVRWYGITNQISLVLKATNRSVLSPLVNALEIYRGSEMLVEGTLPQDVEGIKEIQQHFKLEIFGNGDPCLPVSYSWEWLACNSDISPRITSLNLSSKGLIGSIPSSITLLSALVNIDLSNNNLRGPVPDFLSKLRNLKELILVNNNFSGVVPDSLKHVSVRTVGNPLLLQSSQNFSRSGGRGNKVVIILLPIAGAIAIGFLCLAVVLRGNYTFEGYFLKKNLQKPNKVDTSKCREFTYNELKKITGGFKNVIGKGGFGPVYYGCFDDGTDVAVKVLSKHSTQGAKEFFAEIALLSRVHHKNLVTLMGYCCQKIELILVYEFMSEGNLRKLLRGMQGVLSWENRLQIALNAAQGLEYLHSGCKPPIIHRDVKTTNILLSTGKEAKIADFGLSRDGPSSESTHVCTAVKGTIGYLDPEYFNTGNLTEKTDVYAFGVVLWELISGRPPLFPSNESGELMNIVSWATSIMRRGNIEGVLDTRIAKEEREMNMGSMWKVAELAMICTEIPSNKRPSMNEVVTELKECVQMQRGDGHFIRIGFASFTAFVIASVWFSSMGFI